jgi:hypothetical protein
MTPKEILVKVLEMVENEEKEFVCIAIKEVDGVYSTGRYTPAGKEAKMRFKQMHEPSTSMYAADGGWFEGNYEEAKTKRIAALNATIATFE